MRTRLDTLNNERMRMTRPGEKKAVPVRCNYITRVPLGLDRPVTSRTRRSSEEACYVPVIGLTATAWGRC
ncbi:hypothetical protein NDU88_008682 [Pleurodeles waltl]|uniref:Uncharacterized protein n=1 Tax=Pleurodeles waltl TaxID=8319 RepID=A0AAV7NZN5_PLEWA|nr:hypothetical protein NDU88_008682 [Pleurodeles waltl]